MMYDPYSHTVQKNKHVCVRTYSVCGERGKIYVARY